MKRIASTTILSLTAVFSIGCPVLQDCSWSAPVYSQVTPAEPVGAFSSRDTVGGGKVADNFLIVGLGSAVVHSLRFIGGDTSLPHSDDFRVVFLEDSGGAPGTIIPGGDVAIGPAFLRTPTNGRLLNGITPPIEYIVNFPIGVSLTKNTTYWVSIMNARETGYGWVWARSNGMLDDVIAATSDDVAAGSWSVIANGGMWFELDNKLIPEPRVNTLLSVCVATSALLCGRRTTLKMGSRQN